MRKYFFKLTIIFGLIVGNVINLFSFCVYNKTDVILKFNERRYYGKPLKNFSAYLNPGEKACCNWQNKDCNKSGKRDALIGFDVFNYFISKKDGSKMLLMVCEDFKIKAGGALVATGQNGNYTCEAYGY